MLRLPKHQRVRPPKEDPIHKAIMTGLRYAVRPDVIVFHVPNGGKRNPREAAKLKALGTLAGVADIVIFAASRAYCIEVKRPGLGRQSEDQGTFQEACDRAQVPYEIVTDIQEALECAKRWGLLRPVIPAP